MKRALVALAVLLIAAPAVQAQRIDIGIGTILRNAGISTGIGYRFGRWNDRFGSYVHLDATRVLTKLGKKNRRGPESARGGENVRLRVSPKEAMVFLDGVRVQANGRSELALPVGRHRLEFVRDGYRTEVAELDVQTDVGYEVERKLQKLQRGEVGDSRALNPPAAIPVDLAVKTGTLRAKPEPRPPAPPAPAAPIDPAPTDRG